MQFERCFRLWVATVSELHPGEVIAFDGKQGLRQVVSAWATENNFGLAQLRVDEKTNEIVAVPEILEQLDVTGCLVATDALNCQVKTGERAWRAAAITYWPSRAANPACVMISSRSLTI